MEPTGFRHVKLAQHHQSHEEHSCHEKSSTPGEETSSRPSCEAIIGMSSPAAVSYSDNISNHTATSSASNERSASLLVISQVQEGNMGQQSLISESASSTTTSSTVVPLTNVKRLSNGVSSPGTQSFGVGNEPSKNGSGGGENIGKSGGIGGGNEQSSSCVALGATSVIVENFSSLAVTQGQLSPVATATSEGKTYSFFLISHCEIFIGNHKMY